jgi:hypothetical protein
MLSVITMNAVMMTVIMLSFVVSVDMLSIVMMSFIMLSDILSGIMMSDIILSAVSIAIKIVVLLDVAFLLICWRSLF